MSLRILTILLLIISVSACTKPRTAYPEIDKFDIEFEKKKQEELVKKQQEQEEKTRTVHEERLRSVGGRIRDGGMELCSKLDKVRGGCSFGFSRAKGNEVNAYADGNKIFITAAMIDFASTDEELAIVLGHEYAHNVMGHIKAKKTNALIGNVIGTAVDIAAGVGGVPTGATFSKAGGKAGALTFSKEFEKEADYVGLYITAIAGYDIAHAPDFWRKMSKNDSKAIYIGTTHPSNPERYLGLEKTVAEIKRKKHNGVMLIPNFKD